VYLHSLSTIFRISFEVKGKASAFCLTMARKDHILSKKAGEHEMPKQTGETLRFTLLPGLPFSKGIRTGHRVNVWGTTAFNEKGEFAGKGDLQDP
jgi:hypothetical protein